jgi:Cdc6-like AAA superfamily ATPase
LVPNSEAEAGPPYARTPRPDDAEGIVGAAADDIGINRREVDLCRDLSRQARRHQSRDHASDLRPEVTTQPSDCRATLLTTPQRANVTALVESNSCQ